VKNKLVRRPRMLLKDVQSSLKDVHSRTFMARARAWASARTGATARFNFGHPLRTRDVDYPQIGEVAVKNKLVRQQRRTNW